MGKTTKPQLVSRILSINRSQVIQAVTLNYPRSLRVTIRKQSMLLEIVASHLSHSIHGTLVYLSTFTIEFNHSCTVGYRSSHGCHGYFLKFLNPERLRLLHLHFFHEFHDRGIWRNGKRRFLDCIIMRRCITTHDHDGARRVGGRRVLEVDLGHGLRKLHGRVKEASQRLDRQGKDFSHGFRKVEQKVMGPWDASLTILGPKEKMEIEY